MSELRRHRVNARLSVAELAERSGVSAGAIKNLEEGRTRDPKADTLGKLADALNEGKVPEGHDLVRPEDLDPILTGFAMPTTEQAA